MPIRLLVFLFFNIQTIFLYSQNAFKSGESISYEIAYKWGFIWVEAGEVTFSVNKEFIFNKEVYHFQGIGKTLPRWDWFYKVRDNYEAWSDTSTILPYKFKRDVIEGGLSLNNQYIFNYADSLIKGVLRTNKNSLENISIPLESNSYDVISMIFKARMIDYNQFSIGEKIPIKLLLDGKIYKTHILYLGIENLEIHNQEFECIKFKPSLIEGTIFKSGDEMTVWVTNDENKIPLLITTPILVGDITARIKLDN